MAETPGEWGDHVGSVGREATPARSPGGDPGPGEETELDCVVNMP